MSIRDNRRSKAASAYATEPYLGSHGMDTTASRSTSGGHNGRTVSGARVHMPLSPLAYERIAQRARTLWLASGCLPGRDEQNWREAEVQLAAESVLE